MARSPQVGVEKRRFKNVTPEIHGVTILDADGRAKGVAVDPGAEIWLSEVEEQLTAEAPVRDEDNPFIKHWEAPVAWDEHGNPTGFEPRDGCLVMVDAQPRIIGSRRFTPTHGDPEAAVAPVPPVEGQLADDEVVGTPDAAQAREEHEKAKAAEAATAIELTPEEIEARDKEAAAAAEERAKAIAEGESGRDSAGIEWSEGQPKGAPAKDNPDGRKPVATQG